VGGKALGVKVRRKSSTTGEKPLEKERGEGKEGSLVLNPKEEKQAGDKDIGITGLVAYGSDEDGDW